MEGNLTTIYVSQTAEHKGCVKSIEEALDMVSVLRKKGEKQPVTIRIRDTIYTVTKPIMIGNNVNSVTIEPEHHTLISGGIEVKGFENDTFHGVKCVSVDLSCYGDLKFTDFYVNKKAAVMPKYPKKGTLSAEAVENPSTDLHAHSKWFVPKKEDFENISKFSDLENAIISFNHWWVDEHSPIAAIDRVTRKISLKYQTRFSVSMESEKSALQYVVENVAEMFANPNEWYYDRAVKKLYYIPETEKANAKEIVGFIPVTDKIFCLKGTQKEKVSDITIRNFDIGYTTGDYASFGVANGDTDENVGEGYASDCQGVCDAHGGIELEHAYYCSIENCRLYCFGVHCMVVKDGSKKIRITDNDITNIGAGAIVMSGGEIGSDESTHTCRNTISENKIFHCGKRYFSACGILLMHTYENEIAHNEIGYLYYTGISVGWVWGYDDSIAHHNIIEKNHIHHLGFGQLSDMGGVYLLGKQKGTVVRNNLIHDIKSKVYGGWAIYTDEGSRYALIENNICYNASESPYHQHFGMMNTVRNNIFAFGGDFGVMYTKRENHTGIILENNIIVTKDTPVAHASFEPGDVEENGIPEITCKRNLVFDIKREKPAMLNVLQWKTYSFEEACDKLRLFGDIIVANPEFYDIEHYDFRLWETSPAYNMGFQDIDISDVGCRRKGERNE